MILRIASPRSPPRGSEPRFLCFRCLAVKFQQVVVHRRKNWEAGFASGTGEPIDYHKHARLTVYSRERLVRQVLQEGLTLKLAAASFNVSRQTAAKWVQRYREHGAGGLATHLDILFFWLASSTWAIETNSAFRSTFETRM